VKKTGLFIDKARVVEIMIDMLIEKLPEPVASQTDAVVCEKSPDLGSAAGIIGAISGKK
jgi:hypothetical protein